MSTSVAETSAKTPARAWAVLVVTYLASIAAPMAQFKVPPLSGYIVPAMIGSGIDPASVGTYFGFLMTCMTIIGAVLAFPAAFICKGLGLKATVLVSDACLAVGGLIAAVFGADNLVVLYASRLIEGVGIGLVGVAGPTCVSIWFPEATRGRALGIWATWVPVGCVSMFAIAPYIAAAAGYQAVFWMTAIVAIVAFVAFALVFKYPESDNFGGDPSNADNSGIAGATLGDCLAMLKNKYIWLLGGVFFCFTFNTLGIVNSYYNTFLTLNGFEDTIASNITSIITAIGFVAAPLAGAIFDKVSRPNKRFVVVGIMAMVLVSVAFMWSSGGTGNATVGAQMTSYAWFAMVIFIALQGIGGGAGGGGMRPLAPMVMQQNALAATMAMAVLQLMQNLGSGFGSVIYGSVIDMTDPSTWALPGNLIQIPICIIAIVFAILINPWKNEKKGKKE